MMLHPISILREFAHHNAGAFYFLLVMTLIIVVFVITDTKGASNGRK